MLCLVGETQDGVHIKEIAEIQFIKLRILLKITIVINNNLLIMRRSKTNRIIAGVCGGLETETGLNAWVFRLLFLLGGGFWIYILLCAFIKNEENY